MSSVTGVRLSARVRFIWISASGGEYSAWSRCVVINVLVCWYIYNYVHARRSTEPFLECDVQPSTSSQRREDDHIRPHLQAQSSLSCVVSI